MAFIDVKGLSHKYYINDKDGNRIGEKYAVRDMDFTADEGRFIVILGRNGSGKSTFARHLNGLLTADRGTIYVSGQELGQDNLIDIRQQIGMVFQNPDNQIVGNSVIEDIAFGPENLGVAPDEIWARICAALEKTEMADYAKRNTGALSGGQKQRLAIASVLAMKPKCIVFDEATSMIDPDGAAKIMQTIKLLNKDYGITVIMITHNICEAAEADYIYVMEDGKPCMQGAASDVLKDKERLESIGVLMPLPDDIYVKRENDSARRIVSAKNLSYTYQDGQDKIKALNDISLDIYEGEILAVAGKTGSGKSTMLQLIAGLLKAESGDLTVFDTDMVHTKGLKCIRKRIGYAFQYPEHQLFKDTVLEDVAYGPLNYGMDRDEAVDAAKEALKLVGVDESYYMHAPFELSGGQKKLVAFAGILAYGPEMLILDEPTAGLDAYSRIQMFRLIRRLRDEKNITVVFTSHNMEDISMFADRMVEIKEGANAAMQHYGMRPPTCRRTDVRGPYID